MASPIAMASSREHQLTPKQEAFCFAYIETGNASEAYRRSYDASNMKPETVNRKAAELLDNGKITARLALLQNIHRQRHEITVDSLVDELEQARTLAMKTETPSAAVAATLGKAMICGLIVDRNEHAGKDGAPLVPEPVPNRDLARAIMDILRTARMEPEPEPEATRTPSSST
jgi:phage terminase small subunit